jgi:hypothetical protein
MFFDIPINIDVKEHVQAFQEQREQSRPRELTSVSALAG